MKGPCKSMIGAVAVCAMLASMTVPSASAIEPTADTVTRSAAQSRSTSDGNLMVGGYVTSSTELRAKSNLDISTPEVTIFGDNPGVWWESSDSSVASVYGTGIRSSSISIGSMSRTVLQGTATVTGYRAGTVIISAHVGSYVYSMQVTVKTIAVESVDLGLGGMTHMYVGDQTAIWPSVTPWDATENTVMLSSSDPSVLRIEGETLIAVKPGTATITGTAGDKTATATMTVSKRPLETIGITGADISQKRLEVHRGDSVQVNAEICPSNATVDAYEWASSDTSVALVKDGLITGVADGTATISVAAEGKSDEIVVTVTTPVTSVSISGDNVKDHALALKRGTKAKLTATITPTDATYRSVTWASSNPAVASIAADGMLEAKSDGTAAITVTASDGKQDSIMVTVHVPVEKIAITGTEVKAGYAAVSLGDSLQLKSVISPADASVKKVKWTSSDTDVATVNGNGTVKARKVGTATITATVADKTDAAILTVRFKDVADTTPHQEDIQWLAENAITTGFEDGTYRGMSSVVRQDMAAFLRRLAVKNCIGDAADWTPTDADWKKFKDVDEDTPHAEDILWLAHAGISEGWKEKDGSYTFRGMSPVVRQDMAAFLRRLAAKAGKADGVTPKTDFTDVTSKTPHWEDIQWLGGSGVTEGYVNKDGKTRRYEGMTKVYRQDMAAFLHRLDGRIA